MSAVVDSKKARSFTSAKCSGLCSFLLSYNRLMLQSAAPSWQFNLLVNRRNNRKTLNAEIEQSRMTTLSMVMSGHWSSVLTNREMLWNIKSGPLETGTKYELSSVLLWVGMQLSTADWCWSMALTSIKRTAETLTFNSSWTIKAGEQTTPSSVKQVMMADEYVSFMPGSLRAQKAAFAVLILQALGQPGECGRLKQYT